MSERKPPLSAPDILRRLRIARPPGFQKLLQLHGGNQHKALKSLREEIEFVESHPNLPRDEEFATRVRTWLIDNDLEWSQENLEEAVTAVQAGRSRPTDHRFLRSNLQTRTARS
jgi:hypothetical protein